MTTETFYLRSNNYGQIYSGTYTSRLPLQQQVVETAGKESGGLRLVEDKQVQGPMSSRRHSLHGATNEMKERDGRERYDEGFARIVSETFRREDNNLIMTGDPRFREITEW